MIGNIGETAGRIFAHLAEQQGRPIPLDGVRRFVRGPTVVFNMSIGWLACEGKVMFSTRGRTTLIASK